MNLAQGSRNNAVLSHVRVSRKAVSSVMCLREGRSNLVQGSKNQEFASRSHALSSSSATFSSVDSSRSPSKTGREERFDNVKFNIAFSFTPHVSTCGVFITRLFSGYARSPNFIQCKFSGHTCARIDTSSFSHSCSLG